MLRLLPLVALAAVATPASGATLIDTGVDGSTSVSARSVRATSTLLGQFTLGSDVQIQSIEARGRPVISGDARFSIHADAGNVPGALLYQTTASYIGQKKNSYWGVSGLAWDLFAGVYWVGVGQASPSFRAMIRGAAPNPLGLEGAFKPGGYMATNSADLSWRINGETLTAPIPEPATWGMMILGFAIVGGAIRLQRRRRPMTNLLPA
jgi:hypothetical protein